MSLESDAGEVKTKIRKESSTLDLQLLKYEISSVNTVHAIGQVFRSEVSQLEMVLLNPAAMIGNPQASKDGLEWMHSKNQIRKS